MRENVSEELREFHGWFEDVSFPQVFKRREAKWTVIKADGTSVLTVTGTPDAPGYSISFGPNVPHFLIVRACAEAASDCPRCGTACEEDCMEPDGVVFGVDGDGATYSRVL